MTIKDFMGGLFSSYFQPLYLEVIKSPWGKTSDSLTCLLVMFTENHIRPAAVSKTIFHPLEVFTNL